MGLRYKYYKGERECPYTDDGSAFFWNCEKWWHNFDRKDEHIAGIICKCVYYYKKAGLADFEASDGVPIELKSVFYDMYRQRIDYREKEQFMNFYKAFYGHETD